MTFGARSAIAKGTPRRAGRGYCRRLGIVIGAIAAALAAGELLYRVVLVRRQGPTTNPSIVRHDPSLGWRLRAGAVARHATDEFDVLVRVDGDGRREAPEGIGPPDAPLVLCIGDSFTFGWGVEEHEAFPALLRVRLAARVLNFGVSGYGSDQEYLQLQQEGLLHHPRLVVVTFIANDVEEVTKGFAYGRRKPLFVTEDGRLTLIGHPGREGWLERHSILYLSIRRHAIDAFAPPPDEERIAAGRALVRLMHERMADVVTQHGADLLIVHWGQRWLDREGAHAHFLDLSDALDAAAADGAVTFPLDGHWTALGHRAAADAIAARVTTDRLLKD